MDTRQIGILANGFSEHLRNKYTSPGFEVMPGDTVIDCGAFVGGFTIAASPLCTKVISIEPSSKNRACLERNVSLYGLQNVEILPVAVGEKPGMANLNLSNSGCDDSLLEPDEGATGTSEEVRVLPLAQLIEDARLSDDNTFLKIEAEGFEVEAVLGLGSRRPRTITVDITPERNGESPLDEISSILKGYGYENLFTTPRCLFAKR